MPVYLGRNTEIALLEPLPQRDKALPLRYARFVTGGKVETLRDAERFDGQFEYSNNAIAAVILRTMITERVASDWRAELGGYNWRVASVDQIDGGRQLRLTLDREASDE